MTLNDLVATVEAALMMSAAGETRITVLDDRHVLVAVEARAYRACTTCHRGALGWPSLAELEPGEGEWVTVDDQCLSCGAAATATMPWVLVTTDCRDAEVRELVTQTIARAMPPATIRTAHDLARAITACTADDAIPGGDVLDPHAASPDGTLDWLVEVDDELWEIRVVEDEASAWLADQPRDAAELVAALAGWETRDPVVLSRLVRHSGGRLTPLTPATWRVELPGQPPAIVGLTEAGWSEGAA